MHPDKGKAVPLGHWPTVPEARRQVLGGLLLTLRRHCKATLLDRVRFPVLRVAHLRVLLGTFPGPPECWVALDTSFTQGNQYPWLAISPSILSWHSSADLLEPPPPVCSDLALGLGVSLC